MYFMNKVGEVGIVGRICKVRVASVWNDMGWRETEWKLTQCTRNVWYYVCIYVSMFHFYTIYVLIFCGTYVPMIVYVMMYWNVQ